MSCGRGVPVMAGRQGRLGHITPSAPGPSTDGLALLLHELSSVARSLPCVAGALKETRQMLLTVAFFHPHQLDLWPSLDMLPPVPVRPAHCTIHHRPRTHQHMETQQSYVPATNQPSRVPPAHSHTYAHTSSLLPPPTPTYTHRCSNQPPKLSADQTHLPTKSEDQEEKKKHCLEYVF